MAPVPLRQRRGPRADRHRRPRRAGLTTPYTSGPTAAGGNKDHAPVPGSPFAKRAAFLTVTSFLAGAVGIWTVGVSHEIVNHRLFSCTTGYCGSEPPYGMLALVAGGLLALLYLQSRPDREHARTGTLDEIAKATREMTMAVVGMIVFAFSWRGQGVAEAFLARRRGARDVAARQVVAPASTASSYDTCCSRFDAGATM